jgi:hypothetical protein
MASALRRTRNDWPVWIVATVGACAYAVVFYPGALPFDNAYLWWLARRGETTNAHGIGMSWLWRADNALAPGPGAMFVLQLLLFWSGLALIAQRLSAGARWRIGFVLIAALAPVVFVLFSQVASDAMLVAALTCTVGALLQATAGRSLWLVLGWALLFGAITLGHNAAAAVFPSFLRPR